MMQQAVKAEIVNHGSDGDEYDDTDSVQGVKDFGATKKEKKKTKQSAKDGVDEKTAGKKRTCTIF